MTTRQYRLTVIGSALSWLLLGLHLPTLHELTDHQAMPPTSVLVATAVLAVLSAAGLWALLRMPASERT
ncbi:MAG TPA: hypothetical protein VLE53_08505 [Gemmatimonadaceae bacterium]|nr:hypothetical protein [Gemmatimonadaceae bacterium]